MIIKPHSPRYYIDIKPNNLLGQTLQNVGPMQNYLNRNRDVPEHKFICNYNSVNCGSNI